MKVTSEKMENCQVALNIEAASDELDESLNEAYHRLVSRVSIPGFRKGKAPRVILEQHVGKDALLEEALEHLVPRLYKQAVESQELEPIAEPQIELIQTAPLVFKAVVPLKPAVKLGDYHNIKLEPEPVEVSGEEIDAAIEELQQKQGLWMPVDRPVCLGDLVTINIEADVEGKPFLNHKDVVYEVNVNSVFPLPGFAGSLAGAEKNKEKTFNLAIPDDYSVKEFCGKGCLFKVTATEIKERQLPELNDEFAKSIGYDNLSSMREQISADLKAEAERKSHLELTQKALDAVIEISEVDYPPILEDEEINRLLTDEAQRFGYREVGDFLKKTSKAEEELRQELRPIAKQRVIHSLVLDKLAEEEKIEISAPEVDNKVGEIMGNVEDKEKMQKFLALSPVRGSIERSLRTRKTIDRLIQIVTGSDEDKTKEV
jgi:trigger factor